MSTKIERDTTPHCGLVKPKQTDFYNVDDFNVNMDKIDEQIKVNTDEVEKNSNQIKILEEQVNNLDVSGDVRQVINERVNTDTSKPLSTLVSEWITSAKTVILNGINALTSHVTACRDNTNNHITSQHTVTKNIVNSARDNVNSTVNAARDSIKSHVTSAMNTPKVVKSVQRGILHKRDKSPEIVQGGLGGYNAYPIKISAVNISKSFAQVCSPSGYSSNNYGNLGCLLKDSTTLYVSPNEFTSSIGAQFDSICWEVIEFY